MDLLAFLVDGLLIGFVYGVAAMGLTLIWGVMNVINLAHGPIIALGSFGVYLLFTLAGMNPYLALVFVAIAGLITGMIIYVIAIHRVINAPHLSTLLATFSVNMIIIGLGTHYFKTNMRNVDFTLGSFSAGSRRAFVTQPTLSAAISALEAELGFALLERHARGVRLSAKGAEV